MIAGSVNGNLGEVFGSNRAREDMIASFDERCVCSGSPRGYPRINQGGDGVGKMTAAVKW
jgi:hypothetical protein